MAQRARPSQGKGRSGTRKPVTIDLEANKGEEATGDGTPKAQTAASSKSNVKPPEPVAMQTATTTPPADEVGEGKGAGGPARAARTATAPDKPKPSATAGDRSRDDERPGATATGRPRATATATPPPPPPRRGGMGVVLGGVVGAFVALVIAGGLQWLGLLPSPGAPPETVDLAPLQERIDTLEAEIADLATQPVVAPGDSGLSEEARAQIETAVQTAQDAQSETEAAIGRIESDLAELETAISSGEAGDGPALGALTDRIAALEGRISEQSSQDGALTALKERLAAVEANAGAEQAMAELSASLDTVRAEVETTRQAADAMAGEIVPLQDAITTLQTRLDEEMAGIDARLAEAEATLAEGGADSEAVARAVAAAGLNSAIDRGSAFATELEAYASVAGEDETVAALRDFAASGVPTVSQLAEDFGAVANRIVATGQGLGEDATIGDRLMASARGLVQVRPVGEAEGETPGAVAARIEARLNQGDLEGALAQWEMLPDAAKAVSADFMDQVRARQTVDGLIADALSSAMSAARSVEQGE